MFLNDQDQFTTPAWPATSTTRPSPPAGPATVKNFLLSSL